MDIWCIQEFFYINLPILRRWNHRAKQFFNCQWNHAGVKTVDVFCFFGWGKIHPPKNMQKKAELRLVKQGNSSPTQSWFHFSCVVFTTNYLDNPIGFPIILHHRRSTWNLKVKVLIGISSSRGSFSRSMLIFGGVMIWTISWETQATRIFWGNPPKLNPTVHLDSRWTRLVASITPISRSRGVDFLMIRW